MSVKKGMKPITEKEYLGKVEYVVPQIGYITQILQPPINYIIIAIIIGAMVAKQVMNSRKSVTFADKIEPSDINAEKTDDPKIKEKTEDVIDEKKSTDKEKE